MDNIGLTSDPKIMAEEIKRLRDYVSASSDWFWEMDADLRFSYFSKQMEKKLCFSPEYLLGRHREPSALHPDTQKDWEEHYAKLHAHEPFRDFIYGVKQPNDTVMVVRTSGVPHFDDQGIFQGYRGIGTNITAQHRIERDLITTQARLADAIDCMPDGVLVFDAQERLILCNQRHRDMVAEIADMLVPGQSMRQLIRASLERGVVPMTDEPIDIQIANEVRRLRQAERPREVVLINGRHLFLQERRTSEGGLVCLRRDITAQRRTENALIDARNQAEAANRAKSNFMAVMSHELRTPLNAIIGFSDLLLSGALGDDQTDRHRFLDAIRQSGQHLLALISDVLDITKLDGGNYRLSEDIVSLAALTDQAVSIISRQAELAGLTITEDVPTTFPYLRADPRALRQVILNLLTNAIKFTNPGGKITITASMLPNGDLSLVVQDSGIGIAPTDLPFVIEPFRQAEHALDRHREGSGLGLAICDGIMKLHGGVMHLDSTQGVGTCITLTFPAHRRVADREKNP